MYRKLQLDLDMEWEIIFGAHNGTWLFRKRTCPSRQIARRAAITSLIPSTSSMVVGNRGACCFIVDCGFSAGCEVVCCTCCPMVVDVALDGELTVILASLVVRSGGDGGTGATTSGIMVVVWTNVDSLT